MSAFTGLRSHHIQFSLWNRGSGSGLESCTGYLKAILVPGDKSYFETRLQQRKAIMVIGPEDFHGFAIRRVKELARRHYAVDI